LPLSEFGAMVGATIVLTLCVAAVAFVLLLALRLPTPT